MAVRVLAWLLILTAVFPLMGIREALAWTDPVLTRVSGGDGIYTAGDKISIVFNYTPSFKYETTVCKLYDEEENEVATTEHEWTNTARRKKNWQVNIGTEDLGLEEGTYHLQYYVYYFNDKTDAWRYASIGDSWFTILASYKRGVYLDRTEYKYSVPFSQTGKPKTSFKLYATLVKLSGKVTWTSSNKKVAKVTTAGKVNICGLGTAVIKAKVGLYSDTCTITVEKQTGQEYYEENYEGKFESIGDDLIAAFDSKESMEASFASIYSTVAAIRTLNKKVAVLNKDSKVKSYTNKLVSYARKAKARSLKATVDIDDTAMVNYSDKIENFADKLEDRILYLIGDGNG